VVLGGDTRYQIKKSISDLVIDRVDQIIRLRDRMVTIVLSGIRHQATIRTDAQSVNIGRTGQCRSGFAAGQ
jgi:hypothetical protein